MGFQKLFHTKRGGSYSNLPDERTSELSSALTIGRWMAYVDQAGTKKKKDFLPKRKNKSWIESSIWSKGWLRRGIGSTWNGDDHPKGHSYGTLFYLGDIIKDLIRRRERPRPPSILPVKLGKIDKGELAWPDPLLIECRSVLLRSNLNGDRDREMETSKQLYGD